MSIYFIHVGRYFKIGFSDDAELRFQNLHKSGTRYTFPADASTRLADRSLYRVTDGNKAVEWAIHTAISDYDVGLEWFLDEPELREFIDALPAHPNRHFKPAPLARVGGWCEDEYRRVQAGRAERETARFMARRAS